MIHHAYVDLIPRFFRSYLAEYEAIQSAASDDVEKFVGNPLNSYRLIKKMTSDWKEVKEVITSNSGEALVQNLTGLADFKVSERAQCIKILWESIFFVLIASHGGLFHFELQ